MLDCNYSMLLGRPWLRDAKLSHDWGNNTITILRTSTVRTIFVTKELGALTEHPKVLICYDFHYGIFDEYEDLIFATKLGLFSIGTVVVPTSIWSNQHVKLITLTCLNIVEQVYVLVELVFVLLVSFDIPIEPISILHVKITIPPDTFKQHLLETFFQPKVG